MPIIRTDVEIGNHLNDKSRIIPDSHLKRVCQIGKGEKACRYMCSVPQGFTCVKNTPLRGTIDIQVKTKAGWVAKGDNCDGFGELDAKKEYKDGSK